MKSVFLDVDPKTMGELMEWSLLPEPEFLTKVYGRWSWLRDLAPGTPVQVRVNRYVSYLEIMGE